MALAVRTSSSASSRAFPPKPAVEPAVKVIAFPHTPRPSLPADPGTAEECYMAEPPFSPAWRQQPPGKTRRVRPSSPALLIVAATVLFLGAVLVAILAV